MNRMMNKIVVEKICKTYSTFEGKKNVLKDVSFEIEEGSFTVISGENGSGKTVLMNIISGLETAASGNIKTFGKAGLVFQEADTQILGETIEEDISFGPKNLKWKKEKINEAITYALAETGLTEKRKMQTRFLSGGEKRRLAIACIIAMDLPVIILDEPYANLDYTGVKQVNALLQKLKEKGKTIILLTHEIEKCLAMAQKFIVLYKGEKVFDGKPEEALGENLEKWNIRNPFNSYKSLEDLIWI